MIKSLKDLNDVSRAYWERRYGRDAGPDAQRHYRTAVLREAMGVPGVVRLSPGDVVRVEWKSDGVWKVYSAQGTYLGTGTERQLTRFTI